MFCDRMTALSIAWSMSVRIPSGPHREIGVWVPLDLER